VLALFHGYLWFLVLALSPHSTGRGLGPRRSSGTLQLSTRCSSLALTPSRSLAVPVGWSWLPTPSGSGAASGAANPTSRRSDHATTRSGARNITRGKTTPRRGVGGPFQEDCRPEGLRSYRLHQRETSLEVRQVFMAGPDDKQVEAPTFLRGPFTHNGGELRIMPNENDGDGRWYWEVIKDGREVVARGLADTEPAACECPGWDGFVCCSRLLRPPKKRPPVGGLTC
jgi:hypothetical protein